MADGDQNPSGDSLITMTAADSRIFAVAAVTTNTIEEARTRHRTSPTATAALGKALTGGLLLCAVLMKAGGRLTIRVLGQGPLGGILVDAGFDGSVRGYVAKPDLELPATERGTLDVGGAVGREGFLYVTHDAGSGNSYTGVVELVSGELGEDFTHYLATSEQIPAAVSLGIFVEAGGAVSSAGGLLVQLLPGAGDEIAWRLEQNFKSLPPFTRLASGGQTPEAIARAALTGFQTQLLGNESVRFYCQCSSAKVLAAIASLGPGEIKSMLVEDGKAEVRCHFCNEEYLVSGDQLAELLAAS